MDVGCFYFLTDQYYIDFPDPQLMQNKEVVGGVSHDRPCFYTFKDENSGLYWMIPISSQIKKFRAIYDYKIKKYGKCDTIVFGTVLGHKKAFLIQNMCPVTEEYVKNQYIDGLASVPVRVDGALETELRQKASKILALQRQGRKIVFPDILAIEKKLLEKASEEADVEQ